MALRSNTGHGLLILQVCRSHNDTPQSVGLLWTSDQPVAETSNTQHSQQTSMPHCGIRTHNLSTRAAAGLCLRTRDRWDRLFDLLRLAKDHVVRYTRSLTSKPVRFYFRLHDVTRWVSSQCARFLPATLYFTIAPLPSITVLKH